MHIIQKDLIKRLVIENPLPFSKLTKGYSYEHNVVFHLKKLIIDGYIRKVDKGYYLTRAGLEYSSSFDLITLEDKKYKTLFIGFYIIYEKKILLRVQKNPESFFYKLPGGKPFFDEKYESSVERLFKNETGINIPFNRFSYHQTHLKIQYSSNQEAIFDNVLIIYKVNLLKGELGYFNKENHKWFEEKEVYHLKNVWPEVIYCLKSNQKFHIYNYINDYNLDLDKFIVN